MLIGNKAMKMESVKYISFKSVILNRLNEAKKKQITQEDKFAVIILVLNRSKLYVL